jgi:hypothetical protein
VNIPLVFNYLTRQSDDHPEEEGYEPDMKVKKIKSLLRFGFLATGIYHKSLVIWEFCFWKSSYCGSFIP